MVLVTCSPDGHDVPVHKHCSRICRYENLYNQKGLVCLLACFLTYMLTPWCRIFFENLIVTQLLKQYPAPLQNQKVHYHAHKSLLLHLILSQLNPVCPIDPYLLKVHLRVLCSYLHPGLLSGLLPSGLPTKTL
jgi:hypothetical protein